MQPYRAKYLGSGGSAVDLFYGVTLPRAVDAYLLYVSMKRSSVPLSAVSL